MTKGFGQFDFLTEPYPGAGGEAPEEPLGAPGEGGVGVRLPSGGWRADEE